MTEIAFNQYQKALSRGTLRCVPEARSSFVCARSGGTSTAQNGSPSRTSAPSVSCWECMAACIYIYMVHPPPPKDLGSHILIYNQVDGAHSLRLMGFGSEGGGLSGLGLRT